MRSQSPAARQRQRDLVRTDAFLWIWGMPGAMLLAADAAWHGHRLSTTAAGLLFTAATIWIGIACFINGRRCSRTHCVIDGYLLPPLGVVGLLKGAGVTSVSWQSYLNIFLVIIIAGFVLECLGGKYLRSERG